MPPSSASTGTSTNGARDGAAPTGNIYDLGYRRYEGVRKGRGYAIWALYLASLRGAFGMGRRPSSKIIPFALLIILLVPAIVQLGLVALIAREDLSLIKPENYFGFVRVIVALFCAAVAPELVGRDQRNRTLSLYFSRALMRSDYAVAKILALMTAVAGIVLLPNILLLAGSVLASADAWGYIKDNLDQIPPLIATTAIIAAVMSCVSLAVAAQTPRRAFATGGILALFVIPVPLVGIFVSTVSGIGGRSFIFLNLFSVLGSVNDWLFGVSESRGSQLGIADFAHWTYLAASLAYIAIGAALVFRRYQKIST